MATPKGGTPLVTPIPEEAQRLLGGALHHMRELIRWVATTYTPSTTSYIEEQLQRADTQQTTQWFQASVNVIMPQMGVIYVPPYVGEIATPPVPLSGGGSPPRHPGETGGMHDTVKKEKDSDDDKDKADWGGDTEEEDGKVQARPCEIPSAEGDNRHRLQVKVEETPGACEKPSATKGTDSSQPGREDRTPPREGELPALPPPGPRRDQDGEEEGGKHDGRGKEDEGEEYEEVLVDTEVKPWERLRTTALHHIIPSTTTWETLHHQQRHRRDFPAGAKPTGTTSQAWGRDSRGPCERPSASTKPQAKKGTKGAPTRATSQDGGQDKRGPCERPSASTKPQARTGARMIAKLVAAPKARRSRTPRRGPCATPSAPSRPPAHDKPPLPRKKRTGDDQVRRQEKLGEKVARLASSSFD